MVLYNSFRNIENKHATYWIAITDASLSIQRIQPFLEQNNKHITYWIAITDDSLLIQRVSTHHQQSILIPNATAIWTRVDGIIQAKAIPLLFTHYVHRFFFMKTDVLKIKNCIEWNVKFTHIKPQLWRKGT